MLLSSASKVTSLFSKSQFYSSLLVPGIRHTKIIVGDQMKFRRCYTASQVEQFAQISGDSNPIHINQEAAAKSIFKQRIVHGVLSGSIFSQIIGTTLPDSIYLNQTFKFLAPVFLDEEVEGRMEVLEVNHKKKMIKLKTILVKLSANDKVAIEGEALILYSALSE